MNGQKLATTFIATLFCWLSVALVVPVTAEGSLSRAIVVVGAFWITAELWLAWARSVYHGDEKAKIARTTTQIWRCCSNSWTIRSGKR